MRWYLDTSVVLHAILPDGDPRADPWLKQRASNRDLFVSSALLPLEVTRTLRRDHLPVDSGSQILERTSIIRLDDRVLRYAASIEPHIRSLDAIHLATAVLSETNPTVVTHDETMKAVTKHLGLRAFDPMQT